MKYLNFNKFQQDLLFCGSDAICIRDTFVCKTIVPRGFARTASNILRKLPKDLTTKVLNMQITKIVVGREVIFRNIHFLNVSKGKKVLFFITD